MTTQWIRRAHIFVRRTKIEVAKDKAEQIMPDTNEREMFSVRLSVSGDEPVQSFGCNSALNLVLMQQLKGELIDINPNNVIWFLLRASDNTLMATNEPGTVANNQVWTWEDSIDAIGLQVIEVETI